MADLDKSLDDIISSKPRRGSGPFRGARRGGVQKAAQRKVTPKQKPQQQQQQAAVPARTVQPPRTSLIDQSDKVVISNLPQDITSDAIKDYFSVEIGPIKKVLLAYNESGKSTGVATVIFSKTGDAAKATNRFNGTPIDGGKKKIKVEVIIDPTKKALADRLRPKPAVQPVVQVQAPIAREKRANAKPARGGRGGIRGTRGPFKGRPRRGPPKTAEQLDAEMADYFESGPSASSASAPAPVNDSGDIPM